jgi:hypothetical protein
MVQLIATILFFYVFGLAAILLTGWLIVFCVRFVRAGQHPQKSEGE